MNLRTKSEGHQINTTHLPHYRISLTPRFSEVTNALSESGSRFNGFLLKPLKRLAPVLKLLVTSLKRGVNETRRPRSLLELAVTAKNLQRLINRQRFDSVTLAGGRRRAKQRVVDGFFGRFDYRQE